MGINVLGGLTYGIKFPEGFEFPWDSEKYGGDIDEWWQGVAGFKPIAKSPFDNLGEWRSDICENERDKIYDAWAAERNSWNSSNPIPVELINYCNPEQEMYILAVPIGIGCDWGDPIVFKGLPELSLKDLTSVNDFCNEFSIDTAGEIPRWWLYCEQN